MRLLNEVIEEVCNVPDIPEGLKNNLLEIKNKHLPYCPPESAGMWWRESQIFINCYMPTSPKDLNEWQKKVLKIWTEKEW
jgi:hypothetical protein